MVVYTFNPSREADFCEFKTSLFYIVSFRTAK